MGNQVFLDFRILTLEGESLAQKPQLTFLARNLPFDYITRLLYEADFFLMIVTCFKNGLPFSVIEVIHAHKYGRFRVVERREEGSGDGPAGVGFAAGWVSGVSSTATLAVVSGQLPCAAGKVNRLGREATGPREAGGDKLQAADSFSSGHKVKGVSFNPVVTKTCGST